MKGAVSTILWAGCPTAELSQGASVAIAIETNNSYRLWQARLYETRGTLCWKEDSAMPQIRKPF